MGPIVDHDHAFDGEFPVRLRGVTPASVVIGEDCLADHLWVKLGISAAVKRMSCQLDPVRRVSAHCFPLQMLGSILSLDLDS